MRDTNIKNFKATASNFLHISGWKKINRNYICNMVKSAMFENVLFVDS